ncbi:MAG: glycosyltransferase family 4 protein, partial [Magnetospirillum sp.]|nr:glycosyltransferase family 4 protein [Magnetospirillum sp.]
ALAELLELAYSLPAFVRLLRAWLRHRPDLVYERYNLFFLPGRWLKAVTGCPLLVEVNAPLAHEREARLRAVAAWSERTVWRAADAVLPVTAVLAGHLIAAGVAPARIAVIANGVARERFPAGLDGSATRRALGLEGKVVLGFSGFLRAWHGLSAAIEVMAALPERPDLHLLVIGDGPARVELEERARALGLEGRLTVLGVVPRDRIAACLAAVDIALQPQAVAYASPLKLFEYMALGRAIVAPDQPSIREVLRHGHDALLFPPQDRAAFRAAILALCGDEALRRRLGEAASRTIDGGYTWDSNAARIEALAQGLVVRPQPLSETTP